MKTREREIVLFNGEAYDAPEWLAEVIREVRREESRELRRRHDARGRLHWSELPDGRVD